MVSEVPRHAQRTWCCWPYTTRLPRWDDAAAPGFDIFSCLIILIPWGDGRLHREGRDKKREQGFLSCFLWGCYCDFAGRVLFLRRCISSYVLLLLSYVVVVVVVVVMVVWLCLFGVISALLLLLLRVCVCGCVFCCCCFCGDINTPPDFLSSHENIQSFISLWQNAHFEHEIGIIDFFGFLFFSVWFTTLTVFCGQKRCEIKPPGFHAPLSFLFPWQSRVHKCADTRQLRSI